jgi:pimeloyl-ACP methyl ester carboxylesterase
MFLHGISRAARDFAPFWGALSERWELLALDQRGHGKSDRADSYYVRDYVADAAAVLPTTFSEPAVIFGHSLGALVALGVAAQKPDRVRAIILEDPPGPELIANIEQTPFYSLFSAMQTFAGSKLETSQLARELGEIRLPAANGEVRLKELRDGVSLRFIASCLKDVDPAVYDPLLAGRWLDGVDWKETLRAVRCPVLLLAGDEKLGGMLGKSAIDEMLSHLADAIHIPHPGVGHLIHWQATETCLRHTMGFLESL